LIFCHNATQYNTHKDETNPQQINNVRVAVRARVRIRV
jgi:hypothetical protein